MASKNKEMNKCRFRGAGHKRLNAENIKVIEKFEVIGRIKPMEKKIWDAGSLSKTGR